MQSYPIGRYLDWTFAAPSASAPAVESSWPEITIGKQSTKRNGFSSPLVRQDHRSWSFTPYPVWPAQFKVASPQQNRLFGAPSTTFAVTAVSRYFFVPPLPGHPWFYRMRRSLRRIFLHGRGRTASPISPERRPSGVAH